MAEESRGDAFLKHILSEYPAQKARWSKTPLITRTQALFLSYGVEPPSDTDRGHFLNLHFNQFLEHIDIHHIYSIIRCCSSAWRFEARPQEIDKA